MTELQTQYADALIIQYRDKHKARATAELQSSIYNGDELMLKLKEILDVDIAIGDQLDLVGKLVGIRREVFADDLAGYVLNDEQYRMLIKFKIILNNMSATFGNIDLAVWNAFKGKVIIFWSDKMSLSYVVNKDDFFLVDIARKLDILPRPLGYGIDIVIAAYDPSLLFGFNSVNVITNARGYSRIGKPQVGAFLSVQDILT